MSTAGSMPMSEASTAVPTIRDGALLWLDHPRQWLPALAGKRPYVLVPSEHVLAMAVDLPLASHRQRLKAVPFAVEGMLAEPLSQVHIVLGPQIGPKRYLAAMVAHETMAGWIEILKKAGLSHARILPDFLSLPVPQNGGWMVSATGERVLVRKSDHTGFSARWPTLATAWQLSGRPPIVSCSEPLPGDFMAVQADIAASANPDSAAAGFDLRQGIYAGSNFQASDLLRQAGWLVGCGAVLLSAINIADTIALSRLASQKRDAAQALISRMMPGAVPTDDIDAQLARLLPDVQADREGRFLPLFTRIAEAATPQSEGLTVESLTYDAGDGQLSLDVAAQDLAALQRLEAAMTGAGLRATSGVATAEGGAAKVRIVVEDDPAGGPA